MIQAIHNLHGDSQAMNESSTYGYEVESICTAPYTDEFLSMLFHEQEFSANDIYSIIVRDYNNTIG